MGDPVKFRRKYSSPRRPWDKNRIIVENELIKKYGLKNKREIWVAKALLEKKRKAARLLLASPIEDVLVNKKKLIDSLAKYGILTETATLNDVLALKVEDFLERRLETIVYRLGLANTIKQARQFIVHGKIVINNNKMNTPGYLVKKNEEIKISYFLDKKPKILEKSTSSPEMQKEALKNNEIEKKEKENIKKNKKEDIEKKKGDAK